MLSRVQDNIENIVSTQQYVAIICEQLLFLAFGCSLQKYVHMTIALYHLPLVFATILEYNFNIALQLFYEDVQGFLTWFHHSTVFHLSRYKHIHNASHIKVLSISLTRSSDRRTSRKYTLTQLSPLQRKVVPTIAFLALHAQTKAKRDQACKATRIRY